MFLQKESNLYPLGRLNETPTIGLVWEKENARMRFIYIYILFARELKQNRDYFIFDYAQATAKHNIIISMPAVGYSCTSCRLRTCSHLHNRTERNSKL